MPVKKPRRRSTPRKIPLVRERIGKNERLLTMIRRLALKEQKSQPQVFLSLREAAERFGAPLSSVASVYKQLAEEGLLGSIRASRTMLQKRGAMRSLKIRGLIGMPISTSRFQTLLDYQRCFRCIRDELHERGFLIDSMFFEQQKNPPESVLRRLRDEKVDAVVWLLPDGANSETVLRLRDLGIRFVGVNITPLAGMPCRYQVRRQNAIRAILRAWRDDPKISSAKVVRVDGETPADEERLKKLKALVQSERIPCEIVTLRDWHISKFLKSLCAQNACGVILPARAAALLGWRAPETLVEVLRICRVGLIDGPMFLPFAQRAPEAEVDLVTAVWEPVAKRVVDDLLTGEAFGDSTMVTFEAKPHVRAFLSAFGQAS
jgi:hypothetical protein